MQRVDVLARAGAEAEMVQADAPLLKALAFMFRRRLGDEHAGAAADTGIAARLVHHFLEAEGGEELVVELAARLEAPGGDLDMRDTVDLDHGPWPFFISGL